MTDDTARDATRMVALITGANKGIGYETARLLGERGMRVIVAARDAGRGAEAEKSLRDQGIDATFVRLDVIDEASVTEAAGTVEEEFGRLDVLVNNAGIAEGAATASGTQIDVLRRVYETNVFGVVRVLNALLPLLKRAPAARIVNVSSEMGSIAFLADPESPVRFVTSVPYPSSKTALNMVTLMYAKELSDGPIKVNAANPGFCATDLNGNAGFRTATQGAEVAVHLATLDEDGPTGVLWGFIWRQDGGEGEYGVLPW